MTIPTWRSFARGAWCAAALLLAGCGGVKLWPFAEGGPTETAQVPANSTEYRCEGGRRFFVRQAGANSVWLIAPDREIRLERIGAEGTRYGVGRVQLDLAGDDATLTDPPANFAGCKRATAKP